MLRTGNLGLDLSQKNKAKQKLKQNKAKQKQTNKQTNDCDWNGKSQSLSTTPVAMIYFGRVWGPTKTVDLLDKKKIELTFLGP